MIKKTLFLLLTVFIAGTSYAQQLAFPGAEGFGKYTTGGRGGEVYCVTNLNDSGAGSFRDAVSQPNRIVVFKVAGVIHLKSLIVVKKNITIAGQTAPGEGITLYGNRLAFNGDSGNNIIRHIRVRLGSYSGGKDDAMSISDGKDNFIFDHVSVSWGRDGTFDINSGDSDNITIQDCIIGQGLNKDNHSTGGLIQCGPISIIRTLWIDNKTRNPKIRFKHEYINSVIYNWASNGYIMGGTDNADSPANVIGNYFIAGPSSSLNGYLTRTTDRFMMYPEDNWLDDNKDGELNGRELVAANGDYKTATIMDSPWDYPGVNKVLSAQEAVEHIIDNAGSSMARDEVDKLLINQLKSFGTEGKIINTEEENGIEGNVGAIVGGNYPKDTDNDGMPDAWEDANGTDKNVKDAAEIGADGYANIERYINSINEPIAFLRYPVNIKVTGKSTNSITLQWENTENDLMYVVLEYGIGGDFSESLNLSGETTSYAVDGLESSTEYNFRFKNISSELESEYSGVITVKTDAEEIPPLSCINPQPANASTIESSDYVVFSWENRTGTMAGTLFYDIYLGTTENNMELVASQITETNYHLTDLDGNTKYYWRVKTTNTLGTDDGTNWSFTTGQTYERTTLLYFPFNEESGSSAFDKVGQAEASANNFTPQWQSGILNNTIYFPGTPDNSYLKVSGFDQQFLNNQSFSISLWFKSPGNKPDSYLFHKGMHDKTNDGSGKWIGIQYKNSTLTFGIDDNSNKTTVDLGGANKWFDNNWHFLVCVRDKETGKLIVYVDGEQEGESNDGTSTIGEAGDLILGNRNGYYDNPYPGCLDELKIFDSALTAEEVYGAYLDVVSVGVTDAMLENVSVYPNPFSNELVFNLNNIKTHDDIQLQVLNSSGTIVYKRNVIAEKSGVVRVDELGDLPSGFYFCLVKSGGQQFLQKLVKK
ncbi:MAG: fibronectin type III domain-containing protein [Prolixibacteraceae bacterium]|jgi:hypothetical protein|nr:fibronectin type III domain-containing protein [Prolixibacteraceae bacterium]